MAETTSGISAISGVQISADSDVEQGGSRNRSLRPLFLAKLPLRDDCLLVGLDVLPGFVNAIRAESVETFDLIIRLTDQRGSRKLIPHTGDVEAARRALRNRLDRALALVAAVSPMTADAVTPITIVEHGLLYAKVPITERDIVTVLSLPGASV